jgi:hypothetical protein
MNEHPSLWLRTLVVMAVVAFVAGLCPMAGAADWVELFNGKDLTGWKVKGNPEKNHWTVGKAELDPDNPRNLKVTPGGNEMINAGAHGLDFYCEKKFGDATIELEVMVPKGSNSGIYVMGEYEIQILDSFGKKKLGGGDMGAIYGAAPPKINASKAPGEWQKYVIEYQAPKFDADGKKTANAKMVKVTLNGKVLHENVELKKSTGGALTGKESATGPLMFQGNHGQVAYRNIRIRPK